MPMKFILLISIAATCRSNDPYLQRNNLLMVKAREAKANFQLLPEYSLVLSVRKPSRKFISRRANAR
jgi:hypothetical protein